jgi:WS/DGAT/MGAT family acyltransferase
MVDGIAGVGLLGAILDLEPSTVVDDPVPFEPRTEPSGLAMVIDAWRGLGSDLAGVAARVPGTILRPARFARSAASVLQGLGDFARKLGATPALSIEGTIGPHRSWAHASAALSDVRAVRDVFGGTVNDVVLAAVSGGYRELLLSRGEDADQARVRSLVPVSVRHEDGHGLLDNRVSTLLYDLPVHVADPVERLALVRRQMTDLKGSHMVESGETLTFLGDFVPPMIIGSLSRVVVRAIHRHPQRSVNTVTTNVPGPQVPLYCLGRQMLEYRPFVPISHGVRVSTAILSYNGRLFFGITGDRYTAPDVGVLGAAAARAVDELRHRAATARAPALRKSTRS